MSNSLAGGHGAHKSDTPVLWVIAGFCGWLHVLSRFCGLLLGFVGGYMC